MLEQAIKKLQEEMSKNKDNQAIQAVGNFLIDHIRQNHDDAEKITTDKKSITGAMDYMKEKARKKAKNGYAVIVPDEGLKIVMDYFGIKSGLENAKNVSESAPNVPKPKESVQKPNESAFDIDIDDLL